MIRIATALAITLATAAPALAHPGVHVHPHAESALPVLLGSLEMWTTPSGVYRGHFGEVDSRGRVFSGDSRDETLRADAAACEKIRQLSIAGLLAETMRRISNEESVSSLFVD